MDGWTCPDCGRLFARTRQSHECAPAMDLDEYFATGPPHERPVFDEVMSCLAEVGEVRVEPVSVGMLLKNPHTFAQLRPMQRWVALSFSLQRQGRHPTITRKLIQHGGRWHHIANLASPEDLDDALQDLLVEAYHCAG
jgi:hypothetical protein